MKYLIVIEKTNTGYSAFSPDIEGCVSTGKTLDEIKQNMQDALEFHFEGLRTEGYKIPIPHSSTAYLEVATT